MKAITLHQPWASLVAIEAKKIETRSWNTTYRGQLAIHAGKNTKFVRGENNLLSESLFSNSLAPVLDVWKIGVVPLGCIIATCNLVHVRAMDDAIVFPGCKSYARNGHEWFFTKEERAFGHYEVGRFMWLLEDVQILSEPIPAKGALGLWEWSHEN